MEPKTSVSVVIPARDEQENIAGLVTEIDRVMHDRHDNPRFEIVLVDDGSGDQTLDTALSTAAALGCALQAIRHERSIGQSGALQTGIRRARGNLIITMDGDGQNDPADIPALLQCAATITAEDYCVAGFRKNRRDTQWKRFQSRLANRVRNALLRDGVPDTGCGLKLLPRATFLRLPWFDHAHRFIPALVKGIGGQVAVVEVNHRHRQQGVSKYSAWNRTWAGIVDLVGILWLLHRTRIAQVSEYRDTESA
ncbi:glycosyltransferase family 2 protein [Thiohalomonas denitrificans]|uniref:glycosyltransferase family 2 protein n=1 Tax=Thiohalomonas denitrificans TaxID=415747 RepID=UPI0026F14DE2|nr:glycosyltransferase family 2 protein [Thiohalomonas denitrificans]